MIEFWIPESEIRIPNPGVQDLDPGSRIRDADPGPRDPGSGPRILDSGIQNQIILLEAAVLILGVMTLSQLNPRVELPIMPDAKNSPLKCLLRGSAYSPIAKTS